MNKEFFNKKNILILVITLLIIATMILLIIFNPFGKKKNNSETNHKGYDDVLNKNVNTKEDLIKALEASAEKYYEENYYLTIADPESELEVHSEFGIKLTLNTLNSIQPFSENLSNSLKKYGCNLDTSRIIITPNKPYGKTDYTTKTSLYCNELK